MMKTMKSVETGYFTGGSEAAAAEILAEAAKIIVKAIILA